MNDKTRPLLAVIENSEARLREGRQPVMTVLKPMGRISSFLYRLLVRPGRPTQIDVSLNPSRVEYVVELDDRLFSLLSGGVPRFPNARGDGSKINVVLTPSLDAKAAHAAATDGDAIP